MLPFIIAPLALSQPTVRLEAKFEPLPNLAYQLDIVSGYLPYNQSEVLSKLWKDRFLTQPGDAKLLDRWRDTMRRLEARGQSTFNPKLLYSIATIQNDGEKTREIALNSSSVFQFSRRLAAEIEPQAARDLGTILSRFQPEFMSWWQSEAEPKGGAFAAQASKILASEKLTKLNNQLVNFYQPQLPDGFVVPVQFMYKPKAKEGSHGEQVGNAAVMEFFEGDSPANRMDIIMHELSHFFFRKASLSNHEAFIPRFKAVNDPSSLAVYSIMNEALATALNNGMVAEALMKPEPFQQYRNEPLSWYYNPAIDAVAKASYDWLKVYVESGKTLHDPTFAAEYVKVVRAKLGAQLDAPNVQLFGVNYVWDESWSQDLKYLPSKYLQSTVSSRFSATKVADALTASFNTSPNLSTLLIARPSQVKEIAQAEPLIKPYQKHLETTTKSALLGLRRKGGFAIYVIVANDVEGVEQQLKRLASQRVGINGVLP